MKKSRLKRVVSLLMTLVMSLNFVLVESFAAGDSVDGTATRTADKTNLYLDDEDSSLSEMVLSYTFTPEDITYTAVESKLKEIVLVIDNSGSMSYSVENGSFTTRLSAVKSSATAFVNAVEGIENTTVSLVTYNSYGSVYESDDVSKFSMTEEDEVNDLLTEISNISAGGNTNAGDGLRLAKYLFSDNSDDTYEQYLIFMTDGQSNTFSIEKSTFDFDYGSQNNQIGYFCYTTTGYGYYIEDFEDFSYYTYSNDYEESEDDSELTNTWENVYSGYVNEQSSDYISFDIDSSATRYIKITGSGYKSYNNSDKTGNGFGIYDVDVYKNDSNKYSVEDATASDSSDYYTADKAIDDSSSSLWYTSNSDGDGEWILLDLGEDKAVDKIEIDFYNGKKNNNDIDIDIASEDDYVVSDEEVTTYEGDIPYYYFIYTSNYTDAYEYALSYAETIATMLPDNSDPDFDAHFIAFGSDTGVNTLEDIADVGDYDYQETTSSDGLYSIYSSLGEEVSASYVLESLQFVETIPDGFDIIGVYDDYDTLTESEYVSAEDQVITGDFGNITYSLNSAGTYYEADPITFDVKVQGTTVGDYTFGEDNSAYFSYIDDDGTAYRYVGTLDVTVSEEASSDTVEVDKNILEVTQTGDSELSSYLEDSDSTLTTMSMKEFVGSRDDIEGVYDVIYIGAGDYNTDSIMEYSDSSKSKSVRAAAHDTNDIMNDITELKANEILDGFVDKGQLVVLHEDIYDYTDGMLYEYFSTYQYNDYSNVNVVDSTEDTIIAINSFSYPEAPEVTFTYTPDYMLDDDASKYYAGEAVTFTYTIENEDELSNDLTANFYIDRDFDKQFEESDLSKSESADGSISYTLPSGYSAPYYWKLDIIDNETELQSTETGVFFFSDTKPEIRVLQVTKSYSGADLNSASDFTTEYLSGDEYEITVDVTDISGFNSEDGDYSYSTINGIYDMIFFGFRDSYGDNGISDNAMAALVEFYNTGQGIMLTHDMFINDSTSPKFNEYFKDLGGQTDDQPYLGYYAPNTTTSTNRVNEGIITQYPFELDDSITINTTHNQYYMLDMENEDVVNWYNLTGSNRDGNDSYNHYYIYSVNNITYSGTGHTNSNFPDEEERLFVNTMYRAYFGSNHNPELTMISPDDDTTINEYKDIVVEFVVDDLDLADDTSYVEVWIEGSLVYSDDDYTNGTTFSQTFNDDDYTLDGDYVTVTVRATDDSGASAEESKDVPYVTTDSINEVTRTFPTDAYVSDNNYTVNVSEEHDITYKFAGDSKYFEEDTTEIASSFDLDNVVYTETFPDEVVVTDYPSDMTYDDDTNILTGTVDGLSMVDDDDDGYYEVSGSFDITVQYIAGGTAAFDDGEVTYTEPYEDTDSKTVYVDDDTVEVESFDVTAERIFDTTSVETYDEFTATYTVEGDDLYVVSTDTEEDFSALTLTEIYPEYVEIVDVTYNSSSIDAGDINETSNADGTTTLVVDLADYFKLDKESDGTYSVNDSVDVTLVVNTLMSDTTFTFDSGDLDYTSPDSETGNLDLGTDTIDVNLAISFTVTGEREFVDSEGETLDNPYILEEEESFFAEYTFEGDDLVIDSNEDEVLFDSLIVTDIYPENVTIEDVLYDDSPIDADDITETSNTDGTTTLVVDLTDYIKIQDNDPDDEDDVDDDYEYTLNDSFEVELSIPVESEDYDFTEGDADYAAPDDQTGTVDFGEDSVDALAETDLPDLL